MSENDTDKLNILIKQPRKLFHTKDIELLWGIKNKNTLYSTINRYLKRKILIQIYRGFYSIVESDKINDFELGSSAIHNYCYLSTETILIKSGIIFQFIPYITFCAARKKRVEILSKSFLCRKLDARYLYNTAGIIEHESYKEATPERAVADMLFFNNKYYFDAKSLIDWEKVKTIQKEVGYI